LAGPIYYAGGLRSLLEDRARSPGERALFHIHSIWRYPAYAAFCVAKANELPLVTSLRSNLYAPSLARSAWRKRIARHLFADDLLASSACLHATEAGEIEAVRRLGLRTPVALVPNGVDSSHFRPLGSKAEARAALGLAPDLNYLLFFSRIHPRKNLDLLFDVWQRLAPAFPGWGLLVGGPVEDAAYYTALVEGLGRPLPENRIFELGMRRGDEVLQTYNAADIFVLPSKFENFGNVIAEAMAVELPVVTTKGTPWQMIEEVGAGAWVDAAHEPLQKALTRLMGLEGKERARMGAAGRKLVENMGWEEASRLMLGVYEWALQPRATRLAVPGQVRSVLHFAS
jgi:glycosyltransferase involved in cell wall biosynthesis